MKNLKDHTPKADSWERILKQSEFDNQLANHLDRLPQYSPNEDTWRRITGVMDSKRIVAIWLKWGAAASIIGVLIVAGIALSRFDKDEETQLLSIQNSEVSAGNVAKDSISIEPSGSFQPIEHSTNIPEKKIQAKITTKRTVEIIEVPKISLPELKPTISENLSITTPEPQFTEPIQPKTLHQVSISWSKIKPGLQVTTSFGRKEINPTTETQASNASASQITIEINN
jgi:hypothetical protein